MNNEDIMIGADMIVNPKNLSSDAMSTISSISKSSQAHRRKRASSSKSSSVSSGSSAPSSISSIDLKALKAAHKKKSAESDDSSTISSISDSSDESSESSAMSSISSAINSKRMSQDEIMQLKRELLYQFDRMERKGIKVPKKFSLASSLEEMKLEYERLKMDREVEMSVKFQKHVLMTIVSGAEFLNNKFDPFNLHLAGWSERLNSDMSNFDDVLEQIAIKYRGKANMAPELKLLFLICGSAFTHHLSNTLLKSTFPGADQVLRQNPELMKQFASATINTMAGNTMAGMGIPQTQKQSSFGLGNIIGSLFGFGGGGNEPQQATAAPRTQMRGPSNVDDILRDFQQQNNQNPAAPRSVNDRLEVMSTISESEISEMPDDASVSGIFPSKGRKRPGSTGARRTLDI